jgi:uncharacterized protein
MTYNIASQKGAVVLFLKTPGFTPLKTRLAAGVGQEAAKAFFLHSVERTVNAVYELKSKVNILFILALCEEEKEAACFWRSREHNFDEIVRQGPGDLGQKMAHITKEVGSRFEHLILIGADTPQLSGDILLSALRTLSRSTPKAAVFGPAYDGGFYLFGVKGFLPIDELRSVRYSTPSVMSDLSSALPKDVQITYLQMLRDVDTVADLHAYQML